ncbi:MAG: hypothetical protein C0505_19105 [Leptothrix sp. (in: Bacteria)]|nr:hypothetical protein [Leptothrix sp. (in: b-proteobacteria)]
MAAAPAVDMAAPGLRRRLACFVYEGVLLFGVVMVAGLIWGVATRQQHALVGTAGLQAFTFAVLGTYFVFLWSHGGQTLAMQTWHIRLVTHDGQPVGWWRALCRFLVAWLWFMPALVTLWWSGLKSGPPIFAALLAGVLGYAALAWLHPQRQFWHDAVCGTRLINWKPARKP